MSNNVILTIRVFKGRKAYDENGRLISENQALKLAYGRLEWVNFLKNIAKLYNEAIVESAMEQILRKDNPLPLYKGTEIPLEAHKELFIAMGGQEADFKAPKSAKKVAAKVEAVVKVEKEEEVKNSDDTPDVNEELEDAREQYFEVFGKKAHHLTTLKNLNKKIAKELAKQND